AALMVLAMALVAFMLSRTAGSGWLVVTAAALLGVVAFASVWAALGLVGLRVTVELPTDARVGETMTARLTVAGRLSPPRLVTLRGLDHSTHLVGGNGVYTIRVGA